VERKWYQKKATWAMIVGSLSVIMVAFAFYIEANNLVKAIFASLFGIATLAQNVFLGQREEKETESIVKAIADKKGN